MNINENNSSLGSRLHVSVATWLGEMFDGLDASIFVLVLFPALSELLHTNSHSQVGIYGSIIFATFLVGWTVGALAFGILSDYLGRTKTLIITILVYAICTGLCALSHNWVELAFYRFLVGCGIGGEISVGGVFINECWQGKARLHATAIMCSSYGFGFLVAALLNLCIGSLGWRSLFVAGIVPALLTIYIRAKLKEPAQFQLIAEYKKRLRAKKKAELTTYEANLLKFTLPEIFNSQNRYKVFAVLALASTTIIGYWAAVAWIPPWINQLTGTQAIQERSLVAIVGNIGAIISCALAGLFVTWLGRPNCFRLAFLACFISCVTMFLTTKAYSNTLLIWSFFVGFFTVLPFAFLFIYIPELFDTRIRGTAFGFSMQFGRTIAAVATLVSGQLIAFFGGSYALAASCVACVYLIGLAASFFMPHSHGEVTSELCRAVCEEKGLVAETN